MKLFLVLVAVFLCSALSETQAEESAEARSAASATATTTSSGAGGGSASSKASSSAGVGIGLLGQNSSGGSGKGGDSSGQNSGDLADLLSSQSNGKNSPLDGSGSNNRLSGSLFDGTYLSGNRFSNQGGDDDDDDDDDDNDTNRFLMQNSGSGFPLALLLSRHGHSAHIYHRGDHLCLPDIFAYSLLSQSNLGPFKTLMHFLPLQHSRHLDIKDLLYYNAVSKSLPNFAKIPSSKFH